MVHLKTVYVTNLVFSLETIVLLYFVTTNKLDKAFFILITFLHGMPAGQAVSRFGSAIFFFFFFSSS